MREETQTYKILSACFHRPDKSLFEALQETDLFRESLKDASLEDLKREYTRLFSLTVAGGIPPYETEYGHKDIFFKTQRLADIGGFYGAFGLEMSDASRERVDFIGAELDLMRWLTQKEDHAKKTGKVQEAFICHDAAAKFMRDHLGRWGSFFGDQIAKSANHSFYRRVGRWLCEFVEFECERLGVKPEKVTGWSPEPISTTEFECGFETDPHDEDHILTCPLS